MIRTIYSYCTKELKNPAEKFSFLAQIGTMPQDREVWHKAFQEFLQTENDRKTEEQKKKWSLYRHEFERLQSSLGWYGEFMPLGIERTPTPPLYRSKKDDAIMVYIPPGKFWMGEGTAEKIHEIPYGYYIDKTPVTISQYEKFVKSPGFRPRLAQALELGKINGDEFAQSLEKWSKGPAWWQNKYHAPENWELDGTHPVIGVSWFESLAYSLWAGKSLPHESEWEKAARGGEKIPQWQGERWEWKENPKRKYTWGNDWKEDKVNSASFWVPNYKDWQKEFFDKQLWKKQTLTTSVNDPRFDAAISPYGCKDMLGNVWEWCSDWYEKNMWRSCRGGSWRRRRGYVRVSYRGWGAPVGRGLDLGFRVVCRSLSDSGL